MKSDVDWRDPPPGAEFKKQYFSDQCYQGKAIRDSHISPSGTIENDARSHTKINTS